MLADVLLRLDKMSVLAWSVQVGVADILVPVTVAHDELVHTWLIVDGKSILMRPDDRRGSVILIAKTYVVFWLTRLLLGVTVKVEIYW
jgi:hypothetical protein